MVGTVPGTAKGGGGASRAGIGVRRQKGVRWWRMCQSNGTSTRGGVQLGLAPITFRTEETGDCVQIRETGGRS